MKVKTDTYKDHLDVWLKMVPDQPRGRGYSERVATKSNSIQHQTQSFFNSRINLSPYILTC